MNKILFNSLIVVLFFAFAACGGGGDSAEQTANQEAESESMETMDDGVRTINIYGIDTMKFVVEEEGEGIVTAGTSGDYILLEAINVAPGEEIRITLTTISTLPPTAMSHNWTLLEMGTDADAFARASLAARDNDYIAPDYEDQIIIHTEMLGNGETDSITFTAPEETGSYDYLCTFPAHYGAGMAGTLNVEE